jgi:hypothetical protein
LWGTDGVWIPGIGPKTEKMMEFPVRLLTKVFKLKLGINVGEDKCEFRLNQWCNFFSPALWMVNQWSLFWIMRVMLNDDKALSMTWIP